MGRRLFAGLSFVSAALCLLTLIVGMCIRTRSAVAAALSFSGQTADGRAINTAECIAVAIFAIPPLIWFFVAGENRNTSSTLCPTCGYDLRATPDRCPECGSVPRAPGRGKTSQTQEA